MASSSTSGVVAASDIAPAAFRRAPAQAAGTAGRADDLRYDLGHLMACDTHPFDVEGAAHAPEGAEAFLRAQSRGNVQLLLNRVFNLPQTRTDVPEPSIPSERKRCSRSRTRSLARSAVSLRKAEEPVSTSRVSPDSASRSATSPTSGTASSPGSVTNTAITSCLRLAVTSASS